MTTSPLPRMSDEGEIDPMSDDFSAFVFKIQANMNQSTQRQNRIYAYLFQESLMHLRKFTMYRAKRR